YCVAMCSTLIFFTLQCGHLVWLPKCRSRSCSLHSMPSCCGKMLPFINRMEKLVENKVVVGEEEAMHLFTLFIRSILLSSCLFFTSFSVTCASSLILHFALMYFLIRPRQMV